MVNLPTIDVNQTQADRLLKVFAGPNGTQAEAAANYREWLKSALRDKVITEERALLIKQQQIDLAQHDQAAKTALSDIAPVEQDVTPVPTPIVPPEVKDKAAASGEVAAFQ